MMIMLWCVLRLLIAAGSSLCLVLFLHDHHVLTLGVLAGFLEKFLAFFEFVSQNTVLGLYEFLWLFAAVALFRVIGGFVNLLH